MGLTALVAKVGRLTSDGDGLEKTLRLIQFLVFTYLAAQSGLVNPLPLQRFVQQVAISRRLFRFFKFIGCFAKGLKPSGNPTDVLGMIERLKWSSMGLFILIEDTTLLDAMGVWTVPWASAVFKEAMKFWFYALFLSIVQNVIRLSRVITAAPIDPKSVTSEKTEKVADASSEKRGPTGSEQTVQFAKLIMLDIFDIMIPGAATGWFRVGKLILGVAALMSTVFRLTVIWNRC
ncbi:uncharacterized protein BDZ99DRAFT_420104 [Mytilinidion resinicola]|uniref:Peroxisomal biogenesis factor 11 n=1 Tax=Mytilinidion resinicola TaxID=574789 RepID=A0A6A6YIC9_9PEZI|nr:uncharacterized protein BDZ99DRAFT_420104 [Mytilinidion resinicola]KAF2807677.1 hypothetical protein BDZ99DRAFT_420104 [Mytilinidion resinicola]